jgi:hypothetical protein
MIRICRIHIRHRKSWPPDVTILLFPSWCLKTAWDIIFFQGTEGNTCLGIFLGFQQKVFSYEEGSYCPADFLENYLASFPQRRIQVTDILVLIWFRRCSRCFFQVKVKGRTDLRCLAPCSSSMQERPTGVSWSEKPSLASCVVGSQSCLKNEKDELNNFYS